MKAMLTFASAALLWAGTVAAQGNVTGTWTLEMLWPGGRSSGTCTLATDAGRLSGSCGGDVDQFPITGTVDGRKLSWRADVKQGGAQGRMEFDGEIDDAGTTIKGSCNVGDQFGSFTMTKR